MHIVFHYMDQQQYNKAMDMLFRAKWNIPQAAQSLGMVNTEKSWEAVKDLFSDHCAITPTTFRLDDKSTW